MRSRFAALHWVVLTALLLPLLSGCTIKYMQNSLDDEWFDREKRSWRPPLELGAMTNDIDLGPSAVTLAFQWSNLSLNRETVPPLDDFDEVSIAGQSASARFYPAGGARLRPYAGGGWGRSSLNTHWRGPNYDRSRYDCFGACTSGFSRNIYSGWHGHWIVGLELQNPDDGGPSLLAEYRREIGRGDVFYDLDGSSLSLGLRWQLNIGG